MTTKMSPDIALVAKSPPKTTGLEAYNKKDLWMVNYIQTGSIGNWLESCIWTSLNIMTVNVGKALWGTLSAVLRVFRKDTGSWGKALQSRCFCTTYAGLLTWAILYEDSHWRKMPVTLPTSCFFCPVALWINWCPVWPMLVLWVCSVEPKTSLVDIADKAPVSPNKWKFLIIVIWEYTFWFNP